MRNNIHRFLEPDLPLPNSSDTVTRTIRIDVDIDSSIQKLADEQGISVNALVNKTLRKYVDWDAYAVKFGMLTFGSSGIMNLVSYLTEAQVRKFARQTGSNRTKEMIAFWFKEVNLQNYLRMLKLLADYSGLFQIEEQVEAGKHTIVYHHNMGKNWSIYLEEGTRSVLQELFSINVEIEVSDNQIILHMPNQQAEA